MRKRRDAREVIGRNGQSIDVLMAAHMWEEKVLARFPESRLEESWTCHEDMIGLDGPSRVVVGMWKDLCFANVGYVLKCRSRATGVWLVGSVPNMGVHEGPER